jgi:organic hydroperoxide reductase OsmC/OhrA
MLPDSSTFTCRIRWQGTSNTDYDTFDRRHEVILPGGQKLLGGGGLIVQDPKQTNPEELLAAAVGACMMVTILAVFTRSKIPIVAYEDQPEALLQKGERLYTVTKVTLRPRITIHGTLDRAKLDNLIAKSHANCYITQSVKSEVVVEPTYVMSENAETLKS